MENRLYPREKLDNIDSLYYIQGADNSENEFSGVATDISECGLAIKVVDEEQIKIAEEAKIGTVLKFTFVDEYDFFEEQKTVQIVGIAKVVRKERAEDGLILGCEIPGHKEQIEQYVSDKILVSFEQNKDIEM